MISEDFIDLQVSNLPDDLMFVTPYFCFARAIEAETLKEVANYVADNWPDKKYTLAEIEQNLRAIQNRHAPTRIEDMTNGQKAALDLAVLNLKTHGDDQLLRAVQPLIEYYKARALLADGGKGEAVLTRWQKAQMAFGGVTAPQAECAPRALDGWKLVPLEPTEAMIEAGEGGHSRCDDAEIYRAMIVAVPIAPRADAEKDAARYRWLRADGFIPSDFEKVIDAAILAANKGQVNG